MNVKELREALAAFPDDARVVYVKKNDGQLRGVDAYTVESAYAAHAAVAYDGSIRRVTATAEVAKLACECPSDSVEAIVELW